MKIRTSCCAFALASVFLFQGCTQEKHLLIDEDYRQQVKTQFEARRKLAVNRDSALFSIFEKELSTEQREALQYLYAYMPISDLADYDGDFFLRQVDYALKARKEFPWGKEISEKDFLHFVLPYRVNNENLDTARIVFYEELKDRIQGMNASEAALEVNHWCHEKMCYRGSDGRTSSPLASMRTSFGRCGEESTFAVTALRSIGIPARQVYTPRWAHQDDNHAWVEVFTDGKWHYMGACEPEARLDVGWFDVPAKRAMMIHTKAFGAYEETPEVNVKEKCFSELNVLAHYTDTKTVIIKITDPEKHPIGGARVDFGLYNYAEFYPIVTQYTGADGIVSAQTGKGDLCIWASKGNLYDYSLLRADQDTITLIPDKQPGKEYTENFDLTVPAEKPVEMLDATLIKANSARLVHEDSIRNAYMGTFMQPEEAESLALKLKLDKAETTRYIALSYGNHPEIVSYLTANASSPYALSFLGSLSEKDLRDTPAGILENHLNEAVENPGLSKDIYIEGILSPRIELEIIRPWRNKLKKDFSPDFINKSKEDISILTDWVKQNITVDTENNFYNCRITPLGVHQLKVADPISRNIYYVALCRDMGIPARVNSVTGKVQHYDGKDWQDIAFETEAVTGKRGTLILENSPDNPVKPQYYSHFTLQKYENGIFRSLDYEGKPVMNTFPAALSLEPGYYRIMTGSRYNDGNVRTRIRYFNIAENAVRKIPVQLLPLEERIEILGTIDMDTPVTDTNEKAVTLKELAGENGIALSVIDPGNEPSRHILADLPAVKTTFEQWGGTILIMIPDDKQSSFSPESYKNLPGNVRYGIDKDRILLKRILKSCGKSDEVLPTSVFITPEGNIVFMAQGYRIGLGENLLRVSKLAATSDNRPARKN